MRSSSTSYGFCGVVAGFVPLIDFIRRTDDDKPFMLTEPRRTETHARSDPLDPKTSRHLGQCEYISETDPAVLKFLLKVKPGLGEGYDWVECGCCEAGWQVPHYAESVG